MAKKMRIIKNSKKTSFEDKNVVVPLLAKRLRTANRKKQAMTNEHLRNSMLKHHLIKIPAPKMRSLLHYIRVNGIVRNVIASNSGYYVSKSKEETQSYIKTLDSRIKEINELKTAVKRQGRTLKSKKRSKTNGRK